MLSAHADGLVVLNRQVLKCLHQPSLQVARLGRLDRSVDQALATTDRVEEELSRRQAGVKAVLNESLGGRLL